MNFINENTHILIFAAVLILVCVYLLYYYLRSCIDSEVNGLKKKFKKLQSLFQISSNPEHFQNNFKNTDQINEINKKLEFADENEKTEIDADSYFDPTKLSN